MTQGEPRGSGRTGTLLRVLGPGLLLLASAAGADDFTGANGTLFIWAPDAHVIIRTPITRPCPYEEAPACGVGAGIRAEDAALLCERVPAGDYAFAGVEIVVSPYGMEDGVETIEVAQVAELQMDGTITKLIVPAEDVAAFCEVYGAGTDSDTR